MRIAPLDAANVRLGVTRAEGAAVQAMTPKAQAHARNANTAQLSIHRLARLSSSSPNTALSPHSNGGLTAAAAPRHPKGKASFANKPTDPRLFSSAPAPAARGAVPALRTTNPTPSRGAARPGTTEAVAAAAPRRFRRSATRWR